MPEKKDYLLRGTLPAARHWTRGTAPSVEEYRVQRVYDCAAQCTQTLLEFAR